MQLVLSYRLGLLFILISGSACFPRSEGTTNEIAGADSLGMENSRSGNEQLLHYWENFDFSDTVALNNPEVGEQAFVDFIARFSGNSDTTIWQAITNLFEKADQEPISRQYFIEQFEHYLYDPNSPMRNDAYYELVLEFLLQGNSLKEADRYRLGERLRLVKKNKVGEKALDFEVELAGGNKTNLFDIQAPFTLLFFYEPGCSLCEDVIEQFRRTAALQDLVSKSRLKVLAVYSAGDRSIWTGYQSRIPEGWISGFDRDMQVLSNTLYDLKASPTIYLLDKEKTVVLKDTDLSELDVFFNVK